MCPDGGVGYRHDQAMSMDADGRMVCVTSVPSRSKKPSAHARQSTDALRTHRASSGHQETMPRESLFVRRITGKTRCTVATSDCQIVRGARLTLSESWMSDVVPCGRETQRFVAAGVHAAPYSLAYSLIPSRARLMMEELNHRTMEELETGLHAICQSPKDGGVLELIVRRPQSGEREILDAGELDRVEGLVGDNWRIRGSSRTADGSSHPDMQLNIMNSRVIALVARDKTRWHLAGDQLFIDMDLSAENLPPGTQLMLGSAVIEVTDQPHTGCKKFVARFGPDPLKFINAPINRQLNLRGINAKVIRSGVIRVGDVAKKL